MSLGLWIALILIVVIIVDGIDVYYFHDSNEPFPPLNKE